MTKYESLREAMEYAEPTPYLENAVIGVLTFIVVAVVYRAGINAYNLAKNISEINKGINEDLTSKFD